MTMNNWNAFGTNDDENFYQRGQTASIQQLQEEMNRLFEQMFNGHSQPWTGSAMPASVSAGNFTTSPKSFGTSPTTQGFGGPATLQPFGGPNVNLPDSSQQLQHGVGTGTAQRTIRPRIEVSEDASQLTVLAELPGVDKEDIEIYAGENSLSIIGEKSHGYMTGNKAYHQNECTYGRFQRTIPFPCNVDLNDAKVVFKEGVLKVELPKVGVSKGRRLKIS